MLIARASQLETSKSEFMGVEGKRQEFVLTLDKIIPMEMGFAVAVYCWHDRNDNQFVWFASRVCLDYQEGQEYRIKATVKAHRVYKGIKQTVIKIPKLVEKFYKPFVSEAVDQTGHEQTVNDLWEGI